MPEKLPVPSLESIQILTQDVGSVFQGKMNSVVVALRNALIAFNAQIDAAETASQQVEPAPEDVALEGTNNTYKMTPLRSAQLIEKLLTDATADEAEALTGTSDKLITALLLDLVLEWRLGTAGNLGTAAQRNVMTSLTDATTPDALMPRGAFGLAQINDVYSGNLDDASFGWLLVDASAANNFFGTTCLLFTFSASPVSARKRQELTHAALNITATRTYDAGVWSSWKVVYSTGNILSPVAFIGSTPTGGLMQLVIVNGSTMYTKFPTQLTTILMSVVVNANSLENSDTGTYGISYYTGILSVVMPLTLLGIRSVSANPVELGALSATARTTTANLVDVVVNSKSPAIYTVQLTIEGVFAV